MIERVAFDSNYFDLYRLNGKSYAAISNHPDNISNAGFIDLGDRVVVYDTFLSLEAARDMNRAIRQIAKTDQVIIAISHWHSDHYLGNCAFPKETDIISSARANERIREKMPHLQDRKELLKEISELEASLETVCDEKERLNILNALKFNRNFAHPDLELRYPNLTFEGKMEIVGEKGVLQLRTIDIAHSEGDLIGLVEADKVLFAGDLIFSDNHPYLGAGDPVKLKDELKKFMEMEIDYFVPGHGEICGKEEVQNKIEYIDAIIRLVSANLDNKKELKTTDLPKKFHHYASPSFAWNIRFLQGYVKK